MTRERKGFTLIEVLVVIGIMAVLIAILIPTVQSSIARANKVKAQGDVQRLATAWNAFYNEYGRWPSIACENTTTGLLADKRVVVTLTTRFKESTDENPRGLSFMEFGADELDNQTNFVDPWGTPYRMLFDTDFDGRSERSGAVATSIYVNVAVWSAGPDTLDSSVTEATDDIGSWK